MKSINKLLNVSEKADVVFENSLISRWKIDSGFERFLSRLADKNFFWKKIYCLYYRIFDNKYYSEGLKIIDKTITHYLQFPDIQQLINGGGQKTNNY